MNLIGRLLLFLLTLDFLGTLGCTYSNASVSSNAIVSSNADSGISESSGITYSGTENKLVTSEKSSGLETAGYAAQIKTSKINTKSGIL